MLLHFNILLLLIFSIGCHFEKPSKCEKDFDYHVFFDDVCSVCIHANWEVKSIDSLNYLASHLTDDSISYFIAFVLIETDAITKNEIDDYLKILKDNPFVLDSTVKYYTLVNNEHVIEYVDVRDSEIPLYWKKIIWKSKEKYSLSILVTSSSDLYLRDEEHIVQKTISSIKVKN